MPEPHLVLLFGQQLLVAFEQLKVAGGRDVVVPPLLGQEVSRKALYIFVELHTQLWQFPGDLLGNTSAAQSDGACRSVLGTHTHTSGNVPVCMHLYMH